MQKPWEIRGFLTSFCFRRPLLYPIELRARCIVRLSSSFILIAASFRKTRAGTSKQSLPLAQTGLQVRQKWGSTVSPLQVYCTAVDQWSVHCNGRNPDMAVKPVPNGYHTATPYLIVRGGASALEFYQKAFGATVLFRMDGPGGKVGHAEIRIGNSPIMLADEFPEMGAVSPQSLGGSGGSILLYVEDVDTRFSQAIAAGAKELRPVKDQFYGDRSGTVSDPFGHVWTIATHIEDLTPDEMTKRAEAAMKQHGGC
jgi:PhnB protein